jgi:hypothetical protein
MGFFNKKEKEGDKKETIPGLPELPKLPSFMNFEDKAGGLPQLPDFPRNALGDKSSRDIIKKAIDGKKEEDEGDAFEDDSSMEKMQMIQEFPPKQMKYSVPEKKMRSELSEEFEEPERKIQNYGLQRNSMSSQTPEGFEEARRKLKETEPIFVRIDKFEESRKIFQKTKEQILDIERALDKMKAINQEEDKELSSWEQEILNIKDKISKIEKDIFSKI